MRVKSSFPPGLAPAARRVVSEVCARGSADARGKGLRSPPVFPPIALSPPASSLTDDPIFQLSEELASYRGLKIREGAFK
ncbi:hypothetical protein U9M48_009258, partial [Paspalum notatum var. saurae]